MNKKRHLWRIVSLRICGYLAESGLTAAKRIPSTLQRHESRGDSLAVTSCYLLEVYWKREKKKKECTNPGRPPTIRLRRGRSLRTSQHCNNNHHNPICCENMNMEHTQNHSDKPLSYVGTPAPFKPAPPLTAYGWLQPKRKKSNGKDEGDDRPPHRSRL